MSSDKENACSDSDNNDDDYIMQLFASDEDASFSGFSNAENVLKKRKLTSVVVDPATVKKQKDEQAKVKKKSDGPGKGPGKNKKGKAPAKRKVSETVDENTPSTSSGVTRKTAASNSIFQDYNNLYNLIEDYMESREKSNAPRAEVNILVEPEVSNEVDLNEFNIFENAESENDENFEEGNGVEDEFAYEIPKIFEEDEKFGNETSKSISALVNSVSRRKANVAELVKEDKIPVNCKNITPKPIPSFQFFKVSFLRNKRR